MLIFCVHVYTIKSFYLEEINFSNEHKQDNRNWSKQFNPNSGRLLVSDKFIKIWKKEVDQISDKKTLEELLNINN
ncbi:hypothetical protein [Mycoplasma leonicaptivi]|uniref:hypothetical protein n=1 Tax=Mycoplasma leonicaptivi TaxID=36742 RepID=UPI00048558FC|nr:hypothetical protein [Mycoplasma leonicaptivi]